jgi:mono/diheme cytochrome c family protein
MWRTLAILSALLLIAFLVLAQDKQVPPKSNASTPYYTVPLEAARTENPVKPTPESLARGKKQYGYDCAMCHGKEGDGKGDVSADLKLTMHDETDSASLKERTDGELFYIIKEGKDQMPPEGDRVKDETVWDMVNYVRSFAKKTSPDKATEGKTREDKAPN